MGDLVSVVLPVFLVLGFGYVAAAANLFSEDHIDGLMKFAQNFAIPCLLFRAVSSLDLGGDLNFAMLAAFYGGVLAGFAGGLLGGRYLFGRPWEDSVAFGFTGMFSNTVLLGLPISERAYGAGNLDFNFMIIAFHAPFCYAVGMTVMEVLRNRGASRPRPRAGSPGRCSRTRWSWGSRWASSGTSPACIRPKSRPRRWT